MTEEKSQSETSEGKNLAGLDRRIVLAGGAAAVALVAGLGYYFTRSPQDSAKIQPETTQADPAVAELMKTGELPENIMGKADAPVTIIEYSSMTCPHCAHFHKTTLPDLKKKYIDTGKVRYIIREFPLDNLAAAAFMLARCAGPEKYFPFVDALYEQQENWAFVKGDPVPALLKISKQAGFTKESFTSCLKDQKLLDGINWIRERGNEKFGVRSTPTFFINGELLKGAQDLEAFEKVMEPILQGNVG